MRELIHPRNAITVLAIILGPLGLGASFWLLTKNRYDGFAALIFLDIIVGIYGFIIYIKTFGFAGFLRYSVLYLPPSFGMIIIFHLLLKNFSNTGVW